MWKPRNSYYMQSSAYSRRSSSFIDRDFQLKYSRQILIMSFVGIGFFLLPAFFYAHQNYDIFVKLADLMNPEISDHIKRERFALNMAFVTASIGWLLFWWTTSKKMTAKIAGPAKILRNHMRLLSRGDLSLRPVTLREDDEFKELINTYNYLYSLLKVQNEKELATLESILQNVNHPVAQELVKDLMTARKVRLNVSNTEPAAIVPFASPAATPDSRHAS